MVKASRTDGLDENAHHPVNIAGQPGDAPKREAHRRRPDKRRGRWPPLRLPTNPPTTPIRQARPAAVSSARSACGGPALSLIALPSPLLRA